MMIPLEVKSMDYFSHSPVLDAYGTKTTLSSQDNVGISVQDYISLSISPKQKYTIQEISPDWCYTSESAKVYIIRSKFSKGYSGVIFVSSSLGVDFLF